MVFWFCTAGLLIDADYELRDFKRPEDAFAARIAQEEKQATEVIAARASRVVPENVVVGLDEDSQSDLIGSGQMIYQEQKQRVAVPLAPPVAVAAAAPPPPISPPRAAGAEEEKKSYELYLKRELDIMRSLVDGVVGALR